ncbi:MAG: DNA mismatch repair protein MutT, partial [Paracoccus sp.]
MTMQTPDMPIRDAATMILLRRDAGGGAVLMGMRGASAVFMPSKYVFPGGAVDATDATAPMAHGLTEPHRSRLLCDPRGDA